jgi:hypothetical protein
MTLPVHAHLSRRDFLKFMGVAGAVAIGRQVLYTYTPWLNYDEQVNQENQMFDNTSSNHMVELVRSATLAANSHNTQPWKFAIDRDVIEIHPDYSRHLPVVDSNDRELWITQGCALENLLLAAQAAGYAPEVAYPDANEVIRVQLTADKPQVIPLFNAISLRQTTRSVYNGQPVPAVDLDTLQSLPLEPGVSLRYLTTPAEMESTLEYVNQGNQRQYADRAFVDELISWLRFNKKEAMSTLDGLYSRCSGNPEVPRWLGQMFVRGTKPQRQAEMDAKKLRSSSGVVIITSASDDKTSWVRTGQVYERLALKMTGLNIKSAFLNQPIEVSTLRGQFQSAMGLGSSLPQLLVRFGYAEAMPKSLRRPVEDVLI